MTDTKELYALAYQILTSGNLRLRRNVLKEGIGPESFFKLNTSQLQKLGATKELFPGFLNPLALAQLETDKADKNSIKILYHSSPFFPLGLKTIYDPPLCLFLLGNPSALKYRTLGIVGSRRHSHYGTRVLKKFFPGLIEAKLAIVSGMAYGIDTAAHRLAIDHKGVTIGVNAGGMRHLYPPGNHRLFSDILSAGCIVSEFPLDTVPRPYHFPIRNRIIAGISEKIWVVEAAEKSGSLITARLALENGRDILATPGPIDIPTSEGTNRLIRDGARPILTTDDILDEFGIRIKQNKTGLDTVSFATEERVLLDLLKENGVKDIDFLVEKSKLPVNLVISTLNRLLLNTVLATHPGGGWSINE